MFFSNIAMKCLLMANFNSEMEKNHFYFHSQGLSFDIFRDTKMNKKRGNDAFIY